MSKRRPIHDGEVITLWTVQDIPAYEKMRETGVLEVHDDKFIDPDFLRSYAWLKSKMIERGILPSSPSQAFPVWAWYQYSGHRNLDLRRYCSVDSHQRQVRIEFDVPRNEVLLSDYLLWHSVLNNYYIGDSEREDASYLYFPERYSQEEVENSWEKIFSLEENKKNSYLCTPDIQSIQATVWKIDMKQVRNVTYFTPRS